MSNGGPTTQPMKRRPAFRDAGDQYGANIQDFSQEFLGAEGGLFGISQIERQLAMLDDYGKEMKKVSAGAIALSVAMLVLYLALIVVIFLTKKDTTMIKKALMGVLQDQSGEKSTRRVFVI